MFHKRVYMLHIRQLSYIYSEMHSPSPKSLILFQVLEFWVIHSSWVPADILPNHVATYA